VLLFVGFALFLPGFRTASNMLGLLQNVAILGILGLGMAIVVIGRGIDISMVAVLAVPAGLVLQMVQDGHSLPMAFGAALALALVFGLANGWLIAAEVPAVHHVGVGLASPARMVAMFRPIAGARSCRLRLDGRGAGRVPMPRLFGAAALVSFFCARRGWHLCLRGRQPVRRAHHWHPTHR
jgi:hypothetical protein